MTWCVQKYVRWGFSILLFHEFHFVRIAHVLAPKLWNEQSSALDTVHDVICYICMHVFDSYMYICKHGTNPSPKQPGWSHCATHQLEYLSVLVAATFVTDTQQLQRFREPSKDHVVVLLIWGGVPWSSHELRNCLLGSHFEHFFFFLLVGAIAGSGFKVQGPRVAPAHQPSCVQPRAESTAYWILNCCHGWRIRPGLLAAVLLLFGFLKGQCSWCFHLWRFKT